MTDMKTYLLAWNPNRWEWGNIDEMSNDVKNGNVVYDRWSLGASKRPKKGDKFFLIRLGEEPKGIFASEALQRMLLKIYIGTKKNLLWAR